MNLINPYAVETAVNISLFIFYTMSSCTIMNIILINTRNTSGSAMRRLFTTFQTDVLRSPIGFIFILAGFMIRFGMVIPIGIMIDAGRHDELLEWDMTYKAASHVVSAMFMYIGLAIVFWPTLQKFSYKIFHKETTFLTSLLAFLFWFALVLFGYLVHYSAVKYIVTTH